MTLPNDIDNPHKKGKGIREGLRNNWKEHEKKSTREVVRESVIINFFAPVFPVLLRFFH